VTQVWQRWNGPWVALVMLLALLGVAVAGLLVRQRTQAGMPARRAWRHSLAEVGMIAGTVPWTILLLAPVRLAPDAQRFYLTPFSDIWFQLTGPPGEAVVQLGGNLLVLFTFGAGAAVRFRVLAGPWRLLAAGAAGSLLLESIQLATASGRVFSVDDILLNALGAVLGGLLTRRWWATEPLPVGRQTAPV
jgi:VanZ family protein